MTESHIPFFPNPDNTHCFQCVLKMILLKDFPEKDFSWSELEAFSGKKPDKWTWASRGIVSMKERGYEVINWREFDYRTFSVRGGEYLLERYGREKGQAQIENCDLEYEMKTAAELASALETRQGLPSLEDITSLLDDGYLIICNINSRALNGKDGYTGHFVLIYGVNEHGIQMHDPGPPGEKGRSVSQDTFLKAWEYPNAKERNLIAFRLKTLHIPDLAAKN